MSGNILWTTIVLYIVHNAHGYFGFFGNFANGIEPNFQFDPIGYQTLFQTYINNGPYGEPNLIGGFGSYGTGLVPPFTIQKYGLKEIYTGDLFGSNYGYGSFGLSNWQGDGSYVPHESYKPYEFHEGNVLPGQNGIAVVVKKTVQIIKPLVGTGIHKFPILHSQNGDFGGFRDHELYEIYGHFGGNGEHFSLNEGSLGRDTFIHSHHDLAFSSGLLGHKLIGYNLQGLFGGSNNQLLFSPYDRYGFSGVYDFHSALHLQNNLYNHRFHKLLLSKDSQFMPELKAIDNPFKKHFHFLYKPDSKYDTPDSASDFKEIIYNQKVLGKLQLFYEMQSPFTEHEFLQKDNRILENQDLQGLWNWNYPYLKYETYQYEDIGEHDRPAVSMKYSLNIPFLSKGFHNFHEFDDYFGPFAPHGIHKPKLIIANDLHGNKHYYTGQNTPHGFIIHGPTIPNSVIANKHKHLIPDLHQAIQYLNPILGNNNRFDIQGSVFVGPIGIQRLQGVYYGKFTPFIFHDLQPPIGHSFYHDYFRPFPPYVFKYHEPIIWHTLLSLKQGGFNSIFPHGENYDDQLLAQRLDKQERGYFGPFVPHGFLHHIPIMNHRLQQYQDGLHLPIVPHISHVIQGYFGPFSSPLSIPPHGLQGHQYVYIDMHNIPEKDILYGPETTHDLHDIKMGYYGPFLSPTSYYFRPILWQGLHGQNHYYSDTYTPHNELHEPGALQDLRDVKLGYFGPYSSPISHYYKEILSKGFHGHEYGYGDIHIQIAHHGSDTAHGLNYVNEDNFDSRDQLISQRLDKHEHEDVRPIISSSFLFHIPTETHELPKHKHDSFTPISVKTHKYLEPSAVESFEGGNTGGIKRPISSTLDPILNEQLHKQTHGNFNLLEPHKDRIRPLSAQEPENYDSTDYVKGPQFSPTTKYQYLESEPSIIVSGDHAPELSDRHGNKIQGLYDIAYPYHDSSEKPNIIQEEVNNVYDDKAHSPYLQEKEQRTIFKIPKSSIVENKYPMKGYNRDHTATEYKHPIVTYDTLQTFSKLKPLYPINKHGATRTIKTFLIQKQNYGGSAKKQAIIVPLYVTEKSANIEIKSFSNKKLLSNVGSPLTKGEPYNEGKRLKEDNSKTFSEKASIVIKETKIPIYGHRKPEIVSKKSHFTQNVQPLEGNLPIATLGLFIPNYVQPGFGGPAHPILPKNKLKITPVFKPFNTGSEKQSFGHIIRSPVYVPINLKPGPSITPVIPETRTLGIQSIIPNPLHPIKPIVSKGIIPIIAKPIKPLTVSKFDNLNPVKLAFHKPHSHKFVTPGIYIPSKPIIFPKPVILNPVVLKSLIPMILEPGKRVKPIIPDPVQPIIFKHTKPLLMGSVEPLKSIVLEPEEPTKSILESVSPVVVKPIIIEPMKPAVLKLSKPSIVDSMTPIMEPNMPNILEPLKPHTLKSAQPIIIGTVNHILKPDEPIILGPVKPVILKHAETIISAPVMPIQKPAEPIVLGPVKPVILKFAEPIITDPVKPILKLDEPVILGPVKPAILNSAQPIILRPVKRILKPAAPIILDPVKPAILKSAEPIIIDPVQPILKFDEPIIVGPMKPMILKSAKPLEPIILGPVKPATLKSADPVILGPVTPILKSTETNILGAVKPILKPAEPIILGLVKPIMEPADPIILGPVKPIMKPDEAIILDPANPAILKSAEPVILRPLTPLLKPAEPITLVPVKPFMKPAEPIILGQMKPVMEPAEPIILRPVEAILKPAGPIILGPVKPILKPVEPIVLGTVKPAILLPAEHVILSPVTPILQPIEPIILGPVKPIMKSAEPVILGPVKAAIFKSVQPINLGQEKPFIKPDGPVIVEHLKPMILKAAQPIIVKPVKPILKLDEPLKSAFLKPIKPLIVEPIKPVSLQPIKPIILEPLKYVSLNPIEPEKSILKPMKHVLLEPVKPVLLKPMKPITVEPVRPVIFKPVEQVHLEPINPFLFHKVKHEIMKNVIPNILKGLEPIKPVILNSLEPMHDGSIKTVISDSLKPVLTTPLRHSVLQQIHPASLNSAKPVITLEPGLLKPLESLNGIPNKPVSFNSAKPAILTPSKSIILEPMKSTIFKPIKLMILEPVKPVILKPLEASYDKPFKSSILEPVKSFLKPGIGQPIILAPTAPLVSKPIKYFTKPVIVTNHKPFNLKSLNPSIVLPYKSVTVEPLNPPLIKSAKHTSIVKEELKPIIREKSIIIESQQFQNKKVQSIYNTGPRIHKIGEPIINKNIINTETLVPLKHIDHHKRDPILEFPIEPPMKEKIGIILEKIKPTIPIMVKPSVQQKPFLNAPNSYINKKIDTHSAATPLLKQSSPKILVNEMKTPLILSPVKQFNALPTKALSEEELAPPINEDFSHYSQPFMEQAYDYDVNEPSKQVITGNVHETKPKTIGKSYVIESESFNNKHAEALTDQGSEIQHQDDSFYINRPIGIQQGKSFKDTPSKHARDVHLKTEISTPDNLAVVGHPKSTIVHTFNDLPLKTAVGASVIHDKQAVIKPPANIAKVIKPKVYEKSYNVQSESFGSRKVESTADTGYIFGMHGPTILSPKSPVKYTNHVSLNSLSPITKDGIADEYRKPFVSQKSVLIAPIIPSTIYPSKSISVPEHFSSKQKLMEPPTNIGSLKPSPIQLNPSLIPPNLHPAKHFPIPFKAPITSSFIPVFSGQKIIPREVVGTIKHFTEKQPEPSVPKTSFAIETRSEAGKQPVIGIQKIHTDLSTKHINIVPLKPHLPVPYISRSLTHHKPSIPSQPIIPQDGTFVAHDTSLRPALNLKPVSIIHNKPDVYEITNILPPKISSNKNVPSTGNAGLKLLTPERLDPLIKVPGNPFVSLHLTEQPFIPHNSAESGPLKFPIAVPVKSSSVGSMSVSPSVTKEIVKPLSVQDIKPKVHEKTLVVESQHFTNRKVESTSGTGKIPLIPMNTLTKSFGKHIFHLPLTPIGPLHSSEVPHHNKNVPIIPIPKKPIGDLPLIPIQHNAMNIGHQKTIVPLQTPLTKPVGPQPLFVLSKPMADHSIELKKPVIVKAVELDKPTTVKQIKPLFQEKTYVIESKSFSNKKIESTVGSGPFGKGVKSLEMANPSVTKPDIFIRDKLNYIAPFKHLGHLQGDDEDDDIKDLRPLFPPKPIGVEPKGPPIIGLPELPPDNHEVIKPVVIKQVKPIPHEKSFVIKSHQFKNKRVESSVGNAIEGIKPIVGFPIKHTLPSKPIVPITHHIINHPKEILSMKPPVGLLVVAHTNPEPRTLNSANIVKPDAIKQFKPIIRETSIIKNAESFNTKIIESTMRTDKKSVTPGPIKPLIDIPIKQTNFVSVKPIILVPDDVKPIRHSKISIPAKPLPYAHDEDDDIKDIKDLRPLFPLKPIGVEPKSPPIIGLPELPPVNHEVIKPVVIKQVKPITHEKSFFIKSHQFKNKRVESSVGNAIEGIKPIVGFPIKHTLPSKPIVPITHHIINHPKEILSMKPPVGLPVVTHTIPEPGTLNSANIVKLDAIKQFKPIILEKSFIKKAESFNTKIIESTMRTDKKSVTPGPIKALIDIPIKQTNFVSVKPIILVPDDVKPIRHSKISIPAKPLPYAHDEDDDIKDNKDLRPLFPLKPIGVEPKSPPIIGLPELPPVNHEVIKPVVIKQVKPITHEKSFFIKSHQFKNKRVESSVGNAIEGIKPIVGFPIKHTLPSKPIVPITHHIINHPKEILSMKPPVGLPVVTHTIPEPGTLNSANIVKLDAIKQFKPIILEKSFIKKAESFNTKIIESTMRTDKKSVTPGPIKTLIDIPIKQTNFVSVKPVILVPDDVKPIRHSKITIPEKPLPYAQLGSSGYGIPKISPVKTLTPVFINENKPIIHEKHLLTEPKSIRTNKVESTFDTSNKAIGHRHLQPIISSIPKDISTIASKSILPTDSLLDVGSKHLTFGKMKPPVGPFRHIGDKSIGIVPFNYPYNGPAKPKLSYSHSIIKPELSSMNGLKKPESSISIVKPSAINAIKPTVHEKSVIIESDSFSTRKFESTFDTGPRKTVHAAVKPHVPLMAMSSVPLKPIPIVVAPALSGHQKPIIPVRPIVITSLRPSPFIGHPQSIPLDKIKFTGTKRTAEKEVRPSVQEKSVIIESKSFSEKKVESSVRTGDKSNILGPGKPHIIGPLNHFSTSPLKPIVPIQDIGTGKYIYSRSFIPLKPPENTPIIHKIHLPVKPIISLPNNRDVTDHSKGIFLKKVNFPFEGSLKSSPLITDNIRKDAIEPQTHNLFADFHQPLFNPLKKVGKVMIIPSGKGISHIEEAKTFRDFQEISNIGSSLPKNKEDKKRFTVDKVKHYDGEVKKGKTQMPVSATKELPNYKDFFEVEDLHSKNFFDSAIPYNFGNENYYDHNEGKEVEIEGNKQHNKGSRKFTVLGSATAQAARHKKAAHFELHGISQGGDKRVLSLDGINPYSNIDNKGEAYLKSHDIPGKLNTYHTYHQNYPSYGGSFHNIYGYGHGGEYSLNEGKPHGFLEKKATGLEEKSIIGGKKKIFIQETMPQGFGRKTKIIMKSKPQHMADKKAIEYHIEKSYGMDDKKGTAVDSIKSFNTGLDFYTLPFEEKNSKLDSLRDYVYGFKRFGVGDFYSKKGSYGGGKSYILEDKFGTGVNPSDMKSYNYGKKFSYKSDLGDEDIKPLKLDEGKSVATSSKYGFSRGRNYNVEKGLVRSLRIGIEI